MEFPKIVSFVHNTILTYPFYNHKQCPFFPPQSQYQYINIILCCKQTCDFFFSTMKAHTTTKPFFFFSFSFFIFNSQNSQPPYLWVLFIYLLLFFTSKTIIIYLFIYLSTFIHLNNKKNSISINNQTIFINFQSFFI